MGNEQFEPRIVGFLCRWCSYTGADLAGTSRIQYPPNLAAIRVMCSGRVDPTFIVKALTDGADGVLIAGCHPGDCHYSEGNYKAMRRYPMLLNLLDQFLANDNLIKPGGVLELDASSVTIESSFPGLSDPNDIYPQPIRFGGMGKQVDLNGYSDHYPVSVLVNES